MNNYRIRSTTAVLALCCFCLPWIDIRCNLPNQGLVVISQSGLQMIYGSTTTTVAGNPISTAERKKNAHVAGDRENPVPLVILCCVCLIATLIFSLTISDRAHCWRLTTITSGLATGSMIIQVALGFPLVRDIPRGDAGWNYTPWFWLALLSTIAVFLVSAGESLILPFPNSEDQSVTNPVIVTDRNGTNTTWAQRVQAMSSDAGELPGSKEA